MPPRKKKRAVSRRLASKRMRCRITDRISFCLDDATADAPFRQIMDQRFSDEVARQFDCINGEFAAAKAPQEVRGPT